MKTCGGCQAELTAGAAFCGACGARVNGEVAGTGGDVEATVSRSAISVHDRGDGGGRAVADDEHRHAARSFSSRSDASIHGRFVPGAKVANRYRIVALLGRGGMGEVYRADDLKLGQPVALKFLPQLTADARKLELFHNEVRLSRQVAHPNVCRVYDIGEVDDQHFISMEYIDGEDLKQLLQRIGRLPRDKGVEIAQQLCAGLAAAHDKGVLHRDLKPANVMLDGRGQVRITDFGLAAIADDVVDANSPVGTPAYMAPEQLAEGRTSVQSDLYSLGLILYEVFTGKRALKGATIAELRSEHEASSPSRPSSAVDDMDPVVERVILRCLAKQASERPSSARQVAAALPGGDPLAAALAAGETPSPEMIAAAGSTGGLSLKAGVALLAAVCVMLLALPFIADWVDRVHLSDLALNKPDVLESDARKWIDALGYETPPAEGVIQSTFGFTKDRVKDERGKTIAVDLRFWYRQSSRALSPQPDVLGPLENWRVSTVDPPPIFPGMVTVRLNSAARFGSGEQLIEFLAVPKDVSSADVSAAGTEAALLATVGLTPEDFEEIAPSDASFDWRPPIHADRVSVWRHKSAEPALHVVLATRGAQVIYFRRVTSNATSLMAMMIARMRGHLWPVLTIVMVIFAGVLALSNLRKGRSDTRGALRLALYYFLVSAVLWTVAVDHTPELLREAGLGADYLFRIMAYSLRLWLGYLALEPYVRRLWPGVLISWSRLLTGRFGDPLVGRELLIGCLFGAAVGIAAQFLAVPGHVLNADTIAGGRFVALSILDVHVHHISFGIFNLALLLLFRLLLRKTWLAGLVYGSILAAFVSLPAGGPTQAPAFWLLNIIWAAGYVTLFLRFGLLCAIAGQTMLIVLLSAPHTADFGQWYAAAGATALVVVLLLAAYGFYISTLRPRAASLPQPV